MSTSGKDELNTLYKAHIEEITGRARRALTDQGYDAVVIHAGRIQRKSPFDDAEWPFVPVPMFTHWSPLIWPDSAVVVDASDVRLWAVQPTGFWERPAAPDWSLLQAGMSTEIVNSLSPVQQALPSGRVAFVGHESAAAGDLGIDDQHINPDALVEALEDGRVSKTAYEVAIMAKASLRGVSGHLAAAAAFAAGERSELQIHLAYLRASAQDDADTPYKGIVALGEAAATLHHNVYGDRPHAGSLLIDAGARYMGYPCDITRTYAASNGAASQAFQALIQSMDDLQRGVIDDIAVGMNYEALHDGCHRRLGRVLADHGLVTCSAEAADAEGITRAFFPHGLGHSIGVQVHDVSCRKKQPRPENEFLRNTSEIEAGQIFTIEPGLYFIEPLLSELKTKPAGGHVAWDAVQRLAPFGGIRIEDDVYIRDDGSVRNLTREAFAAVG
ncbi:MAG: Xaa-Pro dipeptidase [Myxococcota bacterium]